MLPPELWLETFTYLPLKALIACSGVSHRWRQLVSAARVTPARHALLDLYLSWVSSPAFLPTRSAIEDMGSFNREEYIQELTNLIAPNTIPEEFETWILEWPERAVVGRLWPTIPHKSRKSGTKPSLGIDGQKLLSPTPYVMSIIAANWSPDGGRKMGGLKLWVDVGGYYTYLVLTADGPNALQGGVRSGFGASDEGPIEDPSFIAYLHAQKRQIEDNFERMGSKE